ncbi:salicylate 1-monooxygenase SalA [Phlyctema vagabunda]|uniref:Salicylate 1-monooxygenase SalA n=1 Tax=Phlyctema vagabunda TaxID=108571 RepID=A0ABR4PTI2_9HELO
MSGSTVIDDQPIEIAIVGGGIIGVIVALGLIKRGINVKIYEQARSLREIGAGLAFTANAIRCMGHINPDIVTCLRAVATSNGDADNPNDWLQWVDGYKQHNPDDESDEKLLFKLDTGYRGFEGCHRAHFLDKLQEVVPANVIHFSKRLESLSEPSEDGKVLLGFGDGTTAEADAVIGCDGIKSRVRTFLLEKDNPQSYAHYTNKVCYRGLIPMDKAIEKLGEYKARNQHMHLGPKAHIVHFPVAGQTLVNVAAFASDPNDWPSVDTIVAPATRADVEEVFADWGPIVRNITHLLPDTLDKWAIFDMYDHPAPAYNRGRICIAGDAAHASAPHHGAGAGIGVEDALCLSTALNLAAKAVQDKTKTKSQALKLALETFNTVRIERSQWLVNSSRTVCEVYEWADPECGDDTDKCFAEIKWRSHKIWNFDIDGMLKDTADDYHKRITSV